MEESAKKVIKDIEYFDGSVKRLVKSIDVAKIDWKDKKYDELVTVIQSMAKGTKSVTDVGKRCKQDINLLLSFER